MSHSKIRIRLRSSSSKRWMNCPGSVRLSEGMVSESSFYAAEGTVAHMLSETYFIDGIDPVSRVDEKNTVDGHEIEVTKEMVDAVGVYIDAVDALMDEHNLTYDDLMVEHTFRLDHLHPELYGTTDLAFYLPKEKLLWVWDYKHGRGVGVEAIDNPQGLIYAIGVLLEKNYPAEKIRFTICQPRYPHPDGPIRGHDIDAMDLLDFAGTVAAAAAATGDPNAPLRAGDWCDWCPAAAICPALRAKVQEAATMEFDEESYDPELLAEALEMRPAVKAWLKAIDEFAYAEARQGRVPPRHKLVEKRAQKKWALDEDSTAEQLIEYGFDPDDIWESKLITPAAAERMLGRTHASDIAGLIRRESSGLTLVSESDKRPAASIDAASEFAEE